MAEATEATTETTTETVTPAQAAEVKSDVSAAIEQTSKGRPISALERAAKALADHDAKPKVAEKAEGKADEKPAKEPEADAAKDEAAKPEDKPAEEAPKVEEPKKEDPRLSRGLAILAEREEKVRKLEARAATVLKEAEAKAASLSSADSADLSLVRAARAAVAKGDQLGALEVLGIDLPKAVEMMSHKIEPTPEDIQRRIVREELEAREKARIEAETAAKKEAAEKSAASEAVEQTEFLDRAMALDSKKFPFTVHRKVTGSQVWDVQKKVAEELGRKPTPLETLERLEKFLRDDYENGVKLLQGQKTEEPKPVPKTEAKPAEKPKATPAKEKEPEEQRNRRPTRRESASERAEAALKRAGLS